MENIKSFESKGDDVERRRQEILHEVGYSSIEALKKDIEDFSDEEDFVAYLKKIIEQLNEIK